jgi:aminoglycoside phosphotransferase (APT) family kinase protein
MAAEPTVEIDAALAGRLIAAQFPQWADLPVRPVVPGGWDNRTFRLGETMSVRLPSAARYAAQAPKEQRWLQRLAPQLPLAIPTPLAAGAPGLGYPWPWSVHGWLEGETLAAAPVADRPASAAALAGFLAALQRITAADGPPAGAHSFFRGGPLSTYDAEVRQAMAALGDRIDAAGAAEVWAAALAAEWRGPPVWLHGDVTPGNLLQKGGRLSAVLDFGCCAVGDPACDLAIAWNFFEGESRAAFRAGLPLDAGAWARGRGWALWKALIVLAGLPGANPLDTDKCGAIIDDVLADHARFGGSR